MCIYQHKNKEIMNRLERIDIGDYIRRFFRDQKNKWWTSSSITSFKEAKNLKEFLNDPKNTTFKSMRDLDGLYYWDDQDVDFVPSNLGEGKGYIFYFICIGCDRRVKYLYEYNMCRAPLCRTCCRLSYRTPLRKKNPYDLRGNVPFNILPNDSNPPLFATHVGIPK